MIVNNTTARDDAIEVVISFQNAIKLNYQKPHTSLFLDPKNIAGGAQIIPESNSGILS